MRTVQIPDIILPTSVGLIEKSLTNTEDINDLVEHTSLEVDVQALEYKTIHVLATEVVIAGMPGPLWVWVELSPYDSATSAVFWWAIGGGGGAMVPTAPHIEGPTGVHLTPHPIGIPWVAHSSYCRVVVQTPVAGTPLTAYWAVQAWFEGV